MEITHCKQCIKPSLVKLKNSSPQKSVSLLLVDSQPTVHPQTTNSSNVDHLYMLAVHQMTVAHLSAYCWSTVYQQTADRFLEKLFFNHTHFQVKITTLFHPITSSDQGSTVTGSSSHLNRTIATASFMTLSPNTRAYRSTSTWRSWKIASTVTINKNGKMVT